MQYLTLILLCNLFLTYAQEVHLHTVAFYNVENLFDPEDHPDTFDEDYTPEGKQHWTQELLDQKIHQIASVIAAIGKKETHKPPLLVGLAEVENRKVLEALVSHPKLRPYDYGIVHYESPDPRGIDVALLYQKQWFYLDYSTVYPLRLIDPKTNYQRGTRDQLVVAGYLADSPLYLTVNHWPSRRGGQRRSESGRMAAARLQRRILDSLQGLNPKANIIVMGDFNDDPIDKSVQLLTTPPPKGSSYTFQPLYNPMVSLFRSGVGSLAYNDRWNLFDQLLISKALRLGEGIKMVNIRLFKPPFLQTPEGKYKGYPYRVDHKGSGLKGYSDHFPVYGILIQPL